VFAILKSCRCDACVCDKPLRKTETNSRFGHFEANCAATEANACSALNSHRSMKSSPSGSIDSYSELWATMPPRSLESLAKEKVAQLECVFLGNISVFARSTDIFLFYLLFIHFRAIAKRRNRLLCQLYRLMHRRDAGPVLSENEGEYGDSDEDIEISDKDLQLFLDKFDLQKKCVADIDIDADSELYKPGNWKYRQPSTKRAVPSASNVSQ